MNSLGVLFTGVNALLLFFLPKRWAHVPFLVGALYMTAGQVVEIGPFHFTVMRLLIALGFIRVWTRKERIGGWPTTLDRLTFLWAVWAVISSVFHNEVSKSLVYRLGFAYDGLGLYWLTRVFVQSEDEFLRVAKTLLLVLIPLALEMMTEKFGGGHNAFAVFGYVNELSEIRNGKIRAEGPFGHSILAGTAGAVCIPLAVLFWYRERKMALAGLAATCSMVLASASSGPILTAGAALGALGVWKFRNRLRALRWAVILGIIALDIVMKDPVYYLMARIDLAGGSTGWHRAALIDSALKHLGEWWLGGTDYTRDWMPTGTGWNDQQTDITNYYLVMGVMGGLPFLLLFAGFLLAAFASIGQTLRAKQHAPVEEQFLVWTLGAILFGHAVTFLSVAYFDQTIVFFYFVLASISSLRVAQAGEVPTAEVETVWPSAPPELNRPVA